MTAARQPRDGRGHYQKHGVHKLKRAVQTLGTRALPTKRTALGRELREWRTALVVDLGGPDALSTQQHVLVDLATTTKLQLDSVDAFLFAMPSLVDKRHRRLWPVVRERQGLATQLRDILRDLGLERRTKPTLDLGTYLAEQRTPSSPPPVEGTSSFTGNTGKGNIGNTSHKPQSPSDEIVFPVEAPSDHGAGNTGNGEVATSATVAEVPRPAAGEAVE